MAVVRRNRTDGDFNLDRSSTPRSTLDGNFSFQAIGPLPNSGQAEMSVLGASRVIQHETSAIVLDFQRHTLRAVLQFHAYGLGFGMFDDVGQRFAADAKKILFHDFGQRSDLAFRG